MHFRPRRSRDSPHSKLNLLSLSITFDFHDTEQRRHYDRIVILGVGTGGTLTANRLRKTFSTSEASIICVDQDDRHVYQPDCCSYPSVSPIPKTLFGPRRQVHRDIEYALLRELRERRGEGRAPHGRRRSRLRRAHRCHRGRACAEETEGLTGRDGWRRSSPSTPQRVRPPSRGALHLRRRTCRVNIVEMPIKCPVAPLEFCSR